MDKLFIDKTKTALAVIDLQKGILSMPTKPYPAHEVIENAAKLVNTFMPIGCQYFLFMS